MHILLLGDSGVGKSTFLNNLNNKVKANVATFGLELYTHNVIFYDTLHKINFFSTSGLNYLHIINDAYAKNSNGYIIFIDVTNRNTLLTIPKWLKKIKMNGGDINDVIIIGTHVDCNDNKISKSEIEYLHQNIPYLEVNLIHDSMLETIDKFLYKLIRKHKNSCSLIAYTNNDKSCICQ